jgi:hypothetical protein
MSLSSFGAQFYSEAEVAGLFADIETTEPDLIRNGTFFIVVDGPQILASGGWTVRKSISATSSDKGLGTVATIRGVFTHPGYADQELARIILDTVEAEAVVRGRAHKIELCSTLSDVLFYQRRGYLQCGPVNLGLSNGQNFGLLRMEKRVNAKARHDALCDHQVVEDEAMDPSGDRRRVRVRRITRDLDAA